MPSRMNFFRLCELIELAAPDHPPLGTTDSPANEPVRFRSNGRLGFPGREIDAVERDPDHPGAPPWCAPTSWGCMASMPACPRISSTKWPSGAMARSRWRPSSTCSTTASSRSSIAWRASTAHPLGFRRDGGDEVSRYLLSLLGLGLGGSAISDTVPTQKLLSMLGLASQRTRTAEGLAGVLQHALPDAGVRVDEFHPVWTRLPAGANERRPLRAELRARTWLLRPRECRAGGHHTARRNSCGPAARPRPAWEVMALLRFYLGHTAHACIEMHVRTPLMPAPALNDGAVRLGYSTQLRAPGESVTRVQLGTWNGIMPSAARPGRADSPTPSHPPIMRTNSMRQPLRTGTLLCASALPRGAASAEP